MSNFILAFAGRKQSGKTTCAQFTKEIFDTISDGDSCKIYNFADSLKNDICINILGLTYDQCYGTDEEKNQLVDCYWENKQLTAREIMQLVGTDMFRKLKTNVWSETTIRKIKQDTQKISLIADCRFPNEVHAIKNAGGLVVKLTRNPYNSQHESEVALDENRFDAKNFDLIIDNQNMTISQQNLLLLNFLKQKGFLPL
jgi:hypothetical protein